MWVVRKVLLLLVVCMGVANAKPLKILVPLRQGFGEFIAWKRTEPHNFSFSGFSVDVFRRCIEKLPYELDYELVPFGDGVHNPTYDDAISLLVSKEVDGIVADITITEDRMRLVDFTQPYIQSSLVMVVPFHYAGVGQLWSFLQPFTAELWGSIVAMFVATGVVFFVVESDNSFFHGHDIKTCITRVFWFTSMTLFFCQGNGREIQSRLGRLMTIFWLMVVLILMSTYTASLTSILSARQVVPSIQSYEDLARSSLPIGYEEGSFVKEYIERSLFIRPSRLIKLADEKEYVNALELGPDRKGGVAAVLVESPYMQSFLNSKCAYTSSGNEIAYFGGFGFAFQKNSTLTNDFSLAIISLSKNRELQNLKDSYLISGKCIRTNAGTLIPVENFKGLFLVIGSMYSLCVLLRILGWILKANNIIANIYY